MLLGLPMGLWLLLAAPAGVFLILCYRKTRLNGFVWLFGSVVVWPTVARFVLTTLSLAVPSIIASRGWTPAEYGAWMMAVTMSETFVGGVLLLVSCVLLYRQLGRQASATGLPSSV